MMPLCTTAISSLDTCGCALARSHPRASPIAYAHADDPLQILGARRVLHLGHPADAAHALDRAIQHGDARRVVAAILEALRPSVRIGTTLRLAMAPTIPHIGMLPRGRGRVGEPYCLKKQALPGLGTGRVQVSRRMLLASRRLAGPRRGGNPRPETILPAGVPGISRKVLRESADIRPRRSAAPRPPGSRSRRARRGRASQGRAATGTKTPPRSATTARRT